MFTVLAEILTLSIVGIVAVGAAVVLIPLLIVGLMYNSLVSKRNQFQSTFATIDVMLKKRYDLIPNLVAAVQGYMTHERDVLETVTKLRSQAVSGKMTDGEKIDVNNQITGALKTIFMSVENYPDLKANKNFLNLQLNMTELEEQISAARRAYNAAVLEYNNSVDMFPSSIIASIFRFGRQPFFQADEAERVVPSAGFKK
jgi:LemA protein